MADSSFVLNLLDQFLYIVPWLIIAGAIASLVWKKSGKRFRVGRRESSLLLSYYTDGVSLYSLAKGSLSTGARYNIVATNGGSMMYIVQLSFYSTARLVAIPTAEGAPRLLPSGGDNQLEEVVLEGDFPKYFKLYASVDQKSNVQYILDPKAMAFTMDFCATHSWEIIDDKLMIIASSATEEVLALDDIEQFIAEIKPRIVKELGHVSNRHRLSYDSLHFLEAQCPVCKSALVRSEHWLTCPNEHGILLTGKVLQLLSSGELEPPSNLQPVMAVVEESSRKLSCPVCSSDMTIVDYLGRGIPIDSCSKCHFRWLDAGEPKQLSI